MLLKLLNELAELADDWLLLLLSELHDDRLDREEPDDDRLDEDRLDSELAELAELADDRELSDDSEESDEEDEEESSATVGAADL
jgi:hypothetical protein